MPQNWAVLASFYGGVILRWGDLIITAADRRVRLARGPRLAADIPVGSSGLRAGVDLERFNLLDHVMGSGYRRGSWRVGF